MNVKRVLLAGISAASLALAMSTSTAEADPAAAGQAWYVSIFGGVLLTETEDLNYNFDGDPYDVDLTFDTGFIVGGAVGVDDFLLDNVRAEVEFAFSSHDPGTWTSVGIVNGGNYRYTVGGEIDVYTILANVWYDFEVGLPVTPYIGGGAGIGFVNNNLRLNLAGPGLFETFTNSSAEFAFQAGAGLKYALDGNISIDVSYRFRGVLDVDPRTNNNLNPSVGDISNMDLFTHSVQAGVTIGWPPR